MKVSYHPAIFGSHTHSVSGEIMVLACQVTLQEHVTKVLNNFMVRSP